MKYFVVVGAAVLLCLSLAAEVSAQNASVTGTVSDSAGALIPGVEVTATNVNTGIVNTTVSNETGTYNFASLQPGTYKLSASLPGFQTMSFSDVRLSQDQQVRFNFELKVGQIATVVDVTADANSSLATTTASVGDVLPVARSHIVYLWAAEMCWIWLQRPPAPSAIISRDSETSASRLRVMAWSSEISEPTAAPRPRRSAVADLVEEVQVLVASIDAATGRGTGQVKLQTRSGTNEYHGALFYSDFNSSLVHRTGFKLWRARRCRTRTGTSSAAASAVR